MSEPSTVADSSEIASVRPPPGAALFRRRAERLAALAPGHAAGDYLAFLSEVCALQGQIGESLQLPRRAELRPGARPLDISEPPPAEWREALDRLLRGAEALAMPAPGRDALRALGRASPSEREALAGRVLRGELSSADLASAPFVGAALQVVYTCAPLPPLDLAKPRDAGCPVCGFGPVAGVVGEDGRRFLCCGLCGAEWHLTRLHCAVCRRQDHVDYVALDKPGPAKAEICSECGVYTKLLYVEKAPPLEVGADDLATLVLDELLAREGLRRNGRNLLLATAG